jgi:hypothetical protein
MQIQNFYSDPVPSVRNPLDSIVLSPHTIKSNGFSLAGMQEDSSDYQLLLPSISSCEYHNQDTCRDTNSLPRYIWGRYRKLIGRCRRRKILKQAQLDVESMRLSR